MNKTIERYLPSALSVLSCGGVIGTAYLSAENTKKYEKEIVNSTSKKKTFFKCYWQTILSASATCGCIILSNDISEVARAGLVSACGFISESFAKYREKVIEHHGIEEHKRILNEIAAEECKPVELYSYGALFSPCLNACNLSKDDKVQLFFDGFSRRFFKSTLARVIDAEYNINRNFTLGDVVSLNDWYDFLGLEQTIEGNELAWYMGIEDEVFWLDFDHEERYLDDGTPYVYLTMAYEPNTRWQEEF